MRRERFDVDVRRERTIVRLANNLLFYGHGLFACRAASLPPSSSPWALSSSQRKQGVWPGGSAVVDRNQQFVLSFPGNGLEAMRQPGTPAGTAGLT